MLAKRLAIVVLLEKGYSYNNVADILHISTSTASNVDHRLKSGGIKRVVKILKQTEDGYVGIMDLLESILNVGGIMPSRTGLGRYRGIPR